MNKQIIIGEEKRIYFVEYTHNYEFQLECFSGLDGKYLSSFTFVGQSTNDLLKFKRLFDDVEYIKVGSYISTRISNGVFYFLHHFRAGVYKLICTNVNFTPVRSFGVTLRKTEINQIYHYIGRII